ncbi:MAG: hypothetical protein DI528_17425 [Shinella sp.]|nr:MAG: hypothetical protein DI528_17425 [Shinella sp.]
MNIDSAMEQYRGPKAVIPPQAGIRYRLPVPGVSVQIKLSLGSYPHFKFSAVRYDLEPGASVDLYATLLAGRMLYCLAGSGDVVLNGQQKSFPEGAFVHLGEGHHATLVNRGGETMEVFSFVFGASAEARQDLLSTDVDGTNVLSLSAEQLSAFGLMSLDEANLVPDQSKGELVYQLQDEGPSFWQAKPSAGFVEVKLSPFTSNIHHYAVLMQTLFPGNAVREHAHNQLNEFFVISKGTALAALDGEEAMCPKGTVIIIGRNVFHRWGNAGDENAQNFAIIDPPGVEGALALTGRLRTVGESWPDDILRNAETGKILHERFGFVIAGDAADRIR